MQLTIYGMNPVLSVLRVLFTVYAVTVFVLSFFIFTPFYFIIFNFWNKRKAPHVAHKVSRIWGQFLLIFYLIRVKITYPEFIDPDETYVFIANHRSMLDIPMYAKSCKNTFRFLAKFELTKIPFFGYMVKNLYITVKRGDKSDRIKSMDAMKTSIEENISVFLCPEGTRNKTQKPLLDFHDGAFRLAIKTQKPVAVLTIINSDKVLSPIGFPKLSPGVIHAEWNKPIVTTGMTDDDVPALKEKCRQLMVEVLKKNAAENPRINFSQSVA